MSGSAARALAETSDARFDQDVLGAGGPVLVEFFATWCGSCRRFASTLKQVAGEYAGRVPAVKVNADENPELVGRYGVSLHADPGPVLRWRAGGGDAGGGASAGSSCPRRS